MDEDALVVRSIFSTLRYPFRLARIFIAVDKIGDDFDVILDIKNLESAAAQVLRNSSHAIALFNRKASNRKIRPVETNQGDISAMKRRKKRQVATWRGGREHLFGKHRTHGMRDRIV